ncbi:asparaginyl-tRNA synthetase [Steccherinum ochraceum]|uniref:asparagine--tRNA ligase n=1 Tax=Steccherinum ochraceum TaxID=92696 RepID=A0A4R0RDE8_9APHY|nr:asparaginyl-tRNA synthetase [Steccherinum ochraceum]
MFFRRLLSTSSSPLPPTIRQLLASKTTSAAAPPSVQVNGWIKSIRKQAKVAFAVISDGSSPQTLQAVFTKDALTATKTLTNGACVRLSGRLVESIGKGQNVELQVEKVECLGECNPPEEYPIQKKALNTDYLRDHCSLRARTDPIAAMLRLRSSTLSGLQRYFEDHEFCYAHTPIITSNDSEGGGETFSVTPSASSHTPQDKPPPDFFGRPAYLTVSSQLHLEALAASLSRVYTISPCFRAERSQTSRHLAEFWMLEAEWAFTNSVDDVTRVVEGAVRSVLRAPSADLGLLREDMDSARLESLRKAVEDETPWTRITYTQAIEELERASASGHTFEVAPRWGDSLRSEHEQWIAEHLVRGPVFVTDYPASLKPFYMRLNDDGKTVACFDLLVPHVGELAGGSLREERLDYLQKALEKAGLDERDYACLTNILLSFALQETGLWFSSGLLFSV